MNVVGKVFCKILNKRLVDGLERQGVYCMKERWALEGIEVVYIDHAYTLIKQGRLREGKPINLCFLHRCRETLQYNIV